MLRKSIKPIAQSVTEPKSVSQSQFTITELSESTESTESKPIAQSQSVTEPKS
jgi:hypothetical protein